MKRVFIILLMLTIALPPIAVLSQYQKIKLPVPDSDILKKLQMLGIDFEGASGKVGGSVELFASGEEMIRLRKEGFAPEVLIPDMQAFYSNRLVRGKMNALGFGYGSMGGNYTFDEVLEQLDSMRLLYPALITEKYSIGNSLQGRDLWAVKISKNPDAVSSAPEVIFTSLTHAREPQGMMNLIYFMWYLLERYGTDPEVTYLVDNRQIYFVPVVNPDGYEANRRISPSGGGMRRKNMRNVVSDNDSYGVDLNRNYGYMWGYDNSGSSPTPTSGTYRGSAGFSEPEPSAIRLFCILHNFRTGLNYHTYQNDLLYPWDYTSAFQCPDSALFYEYASDMTKYNHYTFGPSASTLYQVNGGATDWFYGEQTDKNKIIAMLPEVGNSSDGFWPSSSRILPLAEENLYPNLYIVAAAGSFPNIQQVSIEDNSGDGFFEPGENLTLSVILRNKGMDSTGNLSLRVSASNSFVQLPAEELSISRLDAHSNTIRTIAGSISPIAEPGSYVTIYLALTEGSQRTTYDTTQLYIGTLSSVFADSASSGTTGWNTGIGWGLSTTCHTPDYSFTDSPSGNYADNTDNSMQLGSTLDITNARKAVVRFWARWELEPGWDYATAEFSSDGGSSWFTVPGNYTRGGSGSGAQTTGSYGYDGFHTTWVEDEMDVTPFISPSFTMRFRVQSDGNTNYDGFYVDDIRLIVGYPDTTARTISLAVNSRWNLVSYPFRGSSRAASSIFPSAITPAYAFSPGGYIQQDTVRKGTGYWIKFNGSSNIGMRGPVDTQDTIAVLQGWNLIGSLSSPVPAAQIMSIPGGIVTSQFYGYQNSYQPTETLLPGKGYWVNVNQGGMLVLSTTLFNSMNRITIVPTADVPPPSPSELIPGGSAPIPSEFALAQNYPNPFNPSTVIRYQIPVDSWVSLKLYNTLGELVATIVNEQQPAGYKAAQFNAISMPSGMYFYKLEAQDITNSGNSFMQVKKMALIR